MGIAYCANIVDGREEGGVVSANIFEVYVEIVEWVEHRRLLS